MECVVVKKLLMFILLLCSFMFIGCFGGNKTEKTVLSLVVQDIPSNPSYKGYLAFKQKLEEVSGGRMTLEIIQLTKFGTLNDKFETVSSGQFDVVAVGYSDMADIVPDLELIGAPYIARDYEHFLKIMNAEYGEIVRNDFDELGVILCDSWYVGIRHVTSNKPINSVADFEGLKMRVPPSENLVAFAEAMGAIPVEVSFQEIYQALRAREADAQENPLSIIESKKIFELHKYIAMTGHVLTIVPILVNKAKYASFTEKQKAWFDEAVAYGGQVCNDIVVQEEKTLLDKFTIGNGMLITYPDKDELRKAMQGYYNKLEEKFGADVISNILAIE